MDADTMTTEHVRIAVADAIDQHTKVGIEVATWMAKELQRLGLLSKGPAHDAAVRADQAEKTLRDAVDWARSCSGESADIAADYIEEMGAAALTPTTEETEQ